MIEAGVPDYTAVPCRGDKGGCMSNPGQQCPGGTSHQVRRQLWAAMLDAQSKGRDRIWWYGYSIAVPARVKS